MELFKELDALKDGEFHAIIDQKVKAHLPLWIQASSHIFWLSSPEEQKNLQDYARIMDFFLGQGIHRKSTLYAVGGGATTDLAGFVAATILRGINWIAIPTTLLAMIDGSVGGKVAVNLPQGKNLAGAFHYPEKVIICGDFLTTLPEVEWSSGKGEMLKYGFLSEEIYQLIVAKTSIEEIAIACAEFKAKIVSEDFKENGQRILLNLGHTLGHAFEATLKIPHGHAVAMGMKYLFIVMEQKEALEEWNKLTAHLSLKPELFELRSYPHLKLDSFFSFLVQDKKKIDQMLKLVLVEKIGKCVVQEISLNDLKLKIRASHDFRD